MLRHYCSKILVTLFVLSPVTAAYAALEPHREIMINTQPKAFVPSITLKDVSGTFFDVTGVKIQFSDSVNFEIALNSLGAKRWEVKLSPEQVKSLLGTKKIQKHSAMLMIQSKNDKGRFDSKVKDIEIVIGSEGSSL